MGSGPVVNHLAFTVRDIEASHRFYTDLLGFEKCGEFKGPSYVTPMWFYRGNPEDHHSFALVQVRDGDDIAPPSGWPGFFPKGIVGLNHMAVSYETREEFIERLQVLNDAGVEFLVRGNHGMTHSAYIADPDGNAVEVCYEVPAEMWENDVDAALSYFEYIDSNSPEAMTDSTDYTRF